MYIGVELYNEQKDSERLGLVREMLLEEKIIISIHDAGALVISHVDKPDRQLFVNNIKRFESFNEAFTWTKEIIGVKRPLKSEVTMLNAYDNETGLPKK